MVCIFDSKSAWVELRDQPNYLTFRSDYIGFVVECVTVGSTQVEEAKVTLQM